MQTLFGAEKFVIIIPFYPKYNTLPFYLASSSAKFHLFNLQFKTKCHNQVTSEHLTFETVPLNSGGEEDDYLDDHASLLPLSMDRSMAKGKSTNAHVIPQELQSLMT